MSGAARESNKSRAGHYRPTDETGCDGLEEAAEGCFCVS